MTDTPLVERLRGLIERLWEAHASSQQRVLGSDIFAEAATEITRLQEALAAAETEQEWLAKLQSALAFWMPSVTEAIEIELNGRAGDDAYLLAGFDGEVPVPSWGDKAISRAEAAEAKLASLPALLAETRKKALEEAAALIEANMLCGPEGTEVLLPRSNNGNKLGLAYAAAIRSLAEEVRT